MKLKLSRKVLRKLAERLLLSNFFLYKQKTTRLTRVVFCLKYLKKQTMTKTIIFLLFLLLCGCITEKTVYIGQDKDGYLVVNNTRHTGTKEQLLDFVYAKGVKPKPPGFSLPKEMMFVSEYEQYRHNPKRGFVLYKQREYFWRRVTFLPNVDSVCSVVSLSDNLICIVFNNSQSFYRFKPAEPGYSEKWVSTKFAP
jgi:hypothetical protein